FSSRRRHTRSDRDWSSDVCSSDLVVGRDRDNEAHLVDLVRAFGERTQKPVFVKLPPFGTEVEREVVLALARVAREAGAAGITCRSEERRVGKECRVRWWP